MIIFCLPGMAAALRWRPYCDLLLGRSLSVRR
jgi:hypothetical protein